MPVTAVVVDAVLLGVNVTLTVHWAPPAASEPLQVLVSANSLSEAEKPVILKGALPTLVRATILGGLVVPRA